MEYVTPKYRSSVVVKLEKKNFIDVTLHEDMLILRMNSPGA